jgi:predicted N-formylglutamate amidohydrolase
MSASAAPIASNANTLKGGWPDPIEVVNEDGASEFVLVCEHASRHVPDEYASLGLAERDLVRHIAWDIGAEDLTRRLSARLDAPAFLGTYSRLLIDLNRPLGVPSSIPVLSEATEIPGNMAIDKEERARREERIFEPFHARVKRHLNARLLAGRSTRLLTVHSFTPVYLDEQRPWHAGVLFAGAKEYGASMLAELQRETHLLVEANVPYSIAADGDYAIPVHGDQRGIPAVLLEIRHDQIAQAAGVAEWTDRVARVLGALAQEPRRE